MISSKDWTGGFKTQTSLKNHKVQRVPGMRSVWLLVAFLLIDDIIFLKYETLLRVGSII